MAVAYSYDGTFDGFLTSIFMAYSRREEPEEIVTAGNLQEVFGRDSLEVETCGDYARRVEAGIVKSMGSPCYKKIWTVFLSGEPDKATRIYRYVRRGFEIGRSVYNNITHADVLPVEKMYTAIGREAHSLKQFVRFSETQGGVFYARITPKNSVVPLLMPHFTDRLPMQPFLIYDPAHKLVGVHNLQGWHLVETGPLTVPPPDERELAYRRMWKNFYDTIAIAERINPVCRRTHMPMRFWANMTEHGYIPPEKIRRAEENATVLESIDPQRIDCI